MSTSPVYSRTDIASWLGSSVLQAGERHQAGVRQLRWHRQQLLAEVETRAARPYHVDIAFRQTPLGRWQIAAACSCAAGFQCAHAAAVLLAELARQAQPPEASAINPAVLEWLADFAAPPARPAPASKAAQAPLRLYYLLQAGSKGELLLRLCKARVPAEGKLRQAGEAWSNVEGALRKPISFIDEADLGLLRLLHSLPARPRWLPADYLIHGHSDLAVLEALLASGRCYLDDPQLGFAGPLQAGPARPASLDWQRDGLGRLFPRLQAQPAAVCLALSQGHYLDAGRAELGPLHSEIGWPLLRKLLALPPLGEADLPLVLPALRQQLPEALLPATVAQPEMRVEPVPVLILDRLPTFGWKEHRDYDFELGRADYDIAIPRFDYAGFVLEPGDADAQQYNDEGKLVLVRRNGPAEARRLKELHKLGLKAVAPSRLVAQADDLAGARGLMGLSHERDWPLFMRQDLDKLRERGWRIEIRPGCRHQLAEPKAWFAAIVEAQQGWAVAMEVEFDGQRHALAPMLADLVQRQPQWLKASHWDKSADEDRVILHTQAGQKLAVPAARIKPLLKMLAELFDQVSEGPLQISLHDAPRLVDALSGWQAEGLERVRAFARRLHGAAGVSAVAPPRGLQLALRPYQLQGLSWLQYLREHDLAGILADDMGLGKTAQTLAHILLEKEAGRLTQPALIVLPTSLVPNWQREAQRFAPSLRVLALHGPQRHADFARIAEHDLVITSYALVWRDLAELKRHAYHLLILDEAQAVKNAAARAAEAVRGIAARHRLVLTGTPLENHLGELWAQFDFLLPGFLGDEKSFTRQWRQPIEKNANAERQALLARRIKPFILRRKKDEVARELPAKTEIVHEVELQGAQRELYETVRAAMDKKVAQAVAGKGFARSHLDILDALLKLRQVCCDPRLLKTASALGVAERAKLEALLGMLPELVAEGRSVLLFSQFTSMLGLIATELDAIGLPYLKLTGATRDRATPVARFQAGEVPIFLISLKAGGVGLNLTRADTVIHIDPWWNPAAEAQATDRAHRIGQDKPVFVYKLIVAGSIESRILQLQQRKAALAAGVLGEDGLEAVKFDAAELASLLAPLG